MEIFEKNIKERDKIKCIESILTKVCKEKIVLQKDTSHLDSKVYMQKYISEDKFALQLGLARLPKTGNDVSGDSCIQVKLDDNKHMVALSDGMGSGVVAKKSSQIVTRLLKQTLSAGFDKEDSMELINSTIKLSTEEIYATMDVAIFDLYKGVVEFIKNGCCRTYIKNKQNIEYKTSINENIPPEFIGDSKKMHKILTNLNIKFKEKPTLIIQGESYDHMIEIMSMIKENYEELNIDIIYTYDRILLYNLEDAFFSIEEKQSKKNIFSFLFR